MKKSRELTEMVLEIKNEFPGFNKEELLQYTKWAIPKLYNSLRNGDKPEIKCNTKLINKLNKENIKYRINKNIDHISVQYVELYENIKKGNEMYIKVYSSIFFYDDVDNNVVINSKKDKYWNDIWIVTYKEGIGSKRTNSNCDNCGAVMQYNQLRDIFKCEYCNNIIHNNAYLKWEIVDIELGNQ